MGTGTPQIPADPAVAEAEAAVRAGAAWQTFSSTWPAPADTLNTARIGFPIVRFSLVSLELGPGIWYRMGNPTATLLIDPSPTEANHIMMMPPIDPSPTLPPFTGGLFAREAAAAARIAEMAGALLKSRFATAMNVDFKGATDLVTEMDLASEALIRDELARAFPGDALFGEEAGGTDWHRGRVWVFDPLDGTTNFAHGLPIFSVSIALCLDGHPVAGVVHQPIAGETFVAWAGGGAWGNGARLRVSAQTDLQKALVVTGFPYVIADQIDEVLARLRRMILATQGVRRLGSAAMDLCAVAMGRFDVFWETSLQPWDVAAGLLLVEEAGGRVTDFAGAPMPLDRGQLLATNGRLHEPVIGLLAL